MEDESGTDRADTNKVEVYASVFEDGAISVETTLEGLSVALTLSWDEAHFRLVAPEDHTSIIERVHEPDSENDLAEVAREIEFRLKDLSPHTGALLLGALRAVVVAGERVLSEQIDLAESSWTEK